MLKVILYTSLCTFPHVQKVRWKGSVEAAELEVLVFLKTSQGQPSGRPPDGSARAGSVRDELVCRPSGSCVGRCGETFTRGQRCTCDFGCQAHNECCPDFQATCLTGTTPTDSVCSTLTLRGQSKTVQFQRSGKEIRKEKQQTQGARSSL